MSKRKKSKKNRKPNIVDSRIDLSISKTERERRNLLKATKDLNAFHIKYTATNECNKGTGLYLIKDIEAYNVEFKLYNYQFKARSIKLGELSHAWIPLEVLNNSNNFTEKGVSIVALDEYTRQNKSKSIGFTNPSPAAFVEYIGMMSYGSIGQDMSEYYREGSFLDLHNELIEIVLYKMKEALSNYTSGSNEDLINLYLEDCYFYKLLRKIQKAIEIEKSRIDRIFNNICSKPKCIFNS